MSSWTKTTPTTWECKRFPKIKIENWSGGSDRYFVVLVGDSKKPLAIKYKLSDCKSWVNSNINNKSTNTNNENIPS